MTGNSGRAAVEEQDYAETERCCATRGLAGYDHDFLRLVHSPGL